MRVTGGEVLCVCVEVQVGGGEGGGGVGEEDGTGRGVGCGVKGAWWWKKIEMELVNCFMELKVTGNDNFKYLCEWIY